MLTCTFKRIVWRQILHHTRWPGERPSPPNNSHGHTLILCKREHLLDGYRGVVVHPQVGSCQDCDRDYCEGEAVEGLREDGGCEVDGGRGILAPNEERDAQAVGSWDQLAGSG